jgi:hypothetical protein
VGVSIVSGDDSPDRNIIWGIAAGAKLGVYQKLGSRNGGEVISSDQY